MTLNFVLWQAAQMAEKAHWIYVGMTELCLTVKEKFVPLCFFSICLHKTASQHSMRCHPSLPASSFTHRAMTLLFLLAGLMDQSLEYSLESVYRCCFNGSSQDFTQTPGQTYRPPGL